MTTTGEHEGVEALQGGADSHRGSDLLSPDLPLCVTSGQGASPAIERQERLKLKPSSSGFPVSHVLTFGPEVLATRDVLSAQLSEEFGVSLATARAALEMLGDDEKTRQWFLKQVL